MKENVDTPLVLTRIRSAGSQMYPHLYPHYVTLHIAFAIAR